MNLAVLGAGAWGTALAAAFCPKHNVTLWTRSAAQAESIRESRANIRYLPSVSLPAELTVESDLAATLHKAELIVLVTSTAGMADVLQASCAIRNNIPLLWACKGFELASSRLPHEIAASHLPAAVPCGALSGPSFALEVAQGKPAALTLASSHTEFAADMAAALNSQSLRIYSSSDLIGVELGGALKNIMAIAAGISDGLDLGTNARAALVTRGLAEMTRLGVALGGQPETFMGLAGVGDLLLTATGDLSRNRSVGMQLAKGKPLSDILRELGHVAEGVHSARAALGLARKHGVDMPITEAVCAVLFEGMPALKAVQMLLARDPGPE